MKKFLTITFTILLLLISTSVYANTENWTDEGIYDATWFGDDYSTQTKWEIWDEADLAAFSVAVNGRNTFSGKTIELKADIDLSGKEWTPIVSPAASYEQFAGTFEGNGHTITNLTNTKLANINGFVYYGGFFGSIAGGTIKNLSLTNVSIEIEPESSNSYVGMLVGYCQGGKIYNVNVDGNISVETSKQGANHIGGLIGYSTNSSNQQIHNCTVTINSNNKIKSVSVANEDGVYAVQNVGGLIGYIRLNLRPLEIVGTKVILDGEISAEGGKTSNTSNLGTNVGGMIGLIGSKQNVVIYSSSVTGTGSIISTSDSSNSGDIDYTHCAGGIVGAISSEGNTANDSYVTFNNVGVQIGKISTTTEDEQSAGEHSGGIVGSNLTSTSFENLYQAWAIIDNVEESVGLYGIAGEGTELTMSSYGSGTLGVYSNVEPLFPDEWEGYQSYQYGVIDESFNVALNGDLAEENEGELVSLLNDYVSEQSVSSNYIKWHKDGSDILLGQMIATPKVSVSRENFSDMEYTITPSNSAEFKATVTFEGGEIGDITYQWIEYDYKGNNGATIEGATESTYTVICADTPKTNTYGVIATNTLTTGESLSGKATNSAKIIHNPRQQVNLDFDDSYFVSEYLYDGDANTGFNVTIEELIANAIITDENGNPIIISPDSEGYNYNISWNDRSYDSWTAIYPDEYELKIKIYNNEYECFYTRTFVVNPVIVHVDSNTYKMTKEYDGTTNAGTVEGELAFSYTEGFELKKDSADLLRYLETTTSYDDKNVGENKTVNVTFTIPNNQRNKRLLLFP